MGEARKRTAAAVQEALTALGVEALGGEVQVRWNQREAATPFGQMAYFAEFLNLTGLYRRWVESCPLRYASPNGSQIADVLGTLFLYRPNDFACGKDSPVDHPDARKSRTGAGVADHGEQTPESLEALCGAVALRFGVAA